jgi:hypothetical protein
MLKKWLKKGALDLENCEPLWYTSKQQRAHRVDKRREYYMGEGGGFPWIQVMVSLVSPRLLVACPSTKGAPKSELINLFVGLM